MFTSIAAFFALSRIAKLFGALPVKVIAAAVALLIGLFGVWLGYHRYVVLQDQLITMTDRYNVEHLARLTADSTIDTLIERQAETVANFQELERRRDIEDDKWAKKLDELNVLENTCDAITAPDPTAPVPADPFVDRFNSLNLDLNRLLRGDVK